MFNHIRSPVSAEIMDEGLDHILRETESQCRRSARLLIEREKKIDETEKSIGQELIRGDV